jgi:glycosyltransferase involved in cell wall biosynthesis
MHEQAGRIAYLVKTFPRLSETFILNEVLELERQGLALEIFSIKRPADERNHPSLARVQATVTYLPMLQAGCDVAEACQLILHNLLLLLQSPLRYLKAVAMFYREDETANTPPSKVRTLLQAGYLALAMKRRKLKRLHAHFANIPTSVAELASIMTGAPYSFTAHAKDIYLTDATELDRKIAGARFVLTCTGFNQRYLQDLSHSSTPIILAHHGINLDFFNPSVPAGAKQEPPLIVGVGRLCEKKGFRYLIEACELLREKDVDFRCTIVGYGPGKDELKKQISRLRLEKVVTLAGKMTQDELFQVYSSASIFALPCQVNDDGDRDGIPNVLIEAMAMRLPVVSTHISGIGELVDHMENGILVEQKDSVALAQALEFLLQRPDLRAQFGARGREKVLRCFSLERNVQQVHDWLAGSEGACNDNRDSAGMLVEVNRCG